MRTGGIRLRHLLWLALALVWPVAAAADEQPIIMKITLPTINDQVHEYAKRLAAAVETDSGGRIKAQVYPASQLGTMPRQIEGVQFGSIQVAVIPPEFFVGVDDRFQILSAPGLVGSLAQGQRLSQDPTVLKLMLSLGADKGLHGAALFDAVPSSLIARQPIRHLADIKGKKLRILSGEFMTAAFERLGATPVAMSLSDVLPAVQQGTIDGAVSGLTVFTTMHYQDAAKYVTEIGQPAIFLICEISSKWYAGLPKDLQRIVDEDPEKIAVGLSDFDAKFTQDQKDVWVKGGGELIYLPPDEQSAMMEGLGDVAETVSKSKPALQAAYEAVVEGANRVK